MKFSPKSEKELAADGLWPGGEYDFEIVEAEEATSKAGNDMIKMKVFVFNAEGNKRTVYDYLMESVGYKLRHAAEACGLLSEYESGSLEAFDFQGKTGRCKLTIQKDKTGAYPDRNGIADYIPTVTTASVAQAAQRARAKAPVMDDEIPF